MGMGIGHKIGNGNRKEWECKKSFPVISAIKLDGSTDRKLSW